MVSPTVLPGVAFAQNARRSALLFHWRASDLSLKTVDGSSTGTLTRASVGGLTEGRGHTTDSVDTDVRLVGPAADNQPRWGTSTAGVPHLLLEDTRTNLMPLENPSTGWQTTQPLSTAGTTTVAPDGKLVTLLTDTSTSVSDKMLQDVEVASTVAIITWYTKWNGSTFGGIHRFGIRDNSTAADRGQVLWQFGSTGAMVITSTVAGNVISAPTHIGNNWWRTSLECTGISTGNDNQVDIRPAQDSVATTGGDMFIAHILVEDVASTGLFASSHIPTAGAAVTRAAENLSFPYLAVPQEMTVYVSIRGWMTGQTATKVWSITDSAGAVPYVRLQISSVGTIQAAYDNDTADPARVTGTLAEPTAGADLEILVTLTAAGVLGMQVSTDGGAITTLTDAVVSTLPATWKDTLFWVNSNGTTQVGFNKYEVVKVAAGIKTMQQMREVF